MDIVLGYALVMAVRNVVARCRAVIARIFGAIAGARRNRALARWRALRRGARAAVKYQGPAGRSPRIAQSAG